jgi:hypothetical protein
MSFGHTIKKFIINLNDKLDDPEAKAWDPSLTGKAAVKEQWRWTELAAERWEWRKIIQRTAGWRERAKAEAEAFAAQYEANRAARGEAMAGGGCATGTRCWGRSRTTRTSRQERSLRYSRTTNVRR